MNFVMYGAFKKVSYNKVIFAFSHIYTEWCCYSLWK